VAWRTAKERPKKQRNVIFLPSVFFTFVHRSDGDSVIACKLSPLPHCFIYARRYSCAAALNRHQSNTLSANLLADTRETIFNGAIYGA
jgi:hypothetical protein